MTKNRIITLLIFAVLLVGCSNSEQYPTIAISSPVPPTMPVYPTLDPEFLSPIASAAPTVSEEQSADSTPIPSLTPLPKASETSTPTDITISPPSCSYDDLLQQADAVLANTDHSVFYSEANLQRGLYIWFIYDGEKNGSGDASAYISDLTVEMISVSQAVHMTNQACIDEDFSSIHTIAVDKAFRILQIGSIDPGLLPSREFTPEDDLSPILSVFEVSFQNENAPYPPEPNLTGCSWIELSARISEALHTEAVNQGAYYFISPDGKGTLTAQWMGDKTYEDISGNLVNMLFELSCFKHPVDQIIMNVVNEEGRVIYIGLIEKNEGAFYLTDLNPIYIEP